MMLIEILFLVVMLVWLVSILPVSVLAPHTWANSWLAFLAVLLLGIWEFIPNARW